jgi:hypothetical protein
MPHLREHGFERFDDGTVADPLTRYVAARDGDDRVAARSRDDAGARSPGQSDAAARSNVYWPTSVVPVANPAAQ